MIKLAHPSIQKLIDFKDKQHIVLIIENKHLLYQICSELSSQSNGGQGSFTLSTNTSELLIEDSIILISDITNFIFNSKKNLNFLYKKMSNISKNDANLHLQNNINNQIIDYIENIENNLFVNITHTYNVNPEDLFKAYNIKFEENYKSLIEKIIIYITIMLEISKPKLLVMLFAKEFLSKEDISKLYHHCDYYEIPTIIIESQKFDIILEEKVLLIDNDLCEIIID
jgi:CRISPR-associated protein Csn2